MDGVGLLKELSRELRDLHIGSAVEEVACEELTAVRFAADFVGPNKPCLIKGAVRHWPALHSWTPAQLRARLHDTEVTVDVTPNGRGDAVVLCDDGEGGTRSLFTTPRERRLLFAEFVDLFFHSRKPASDEVPYLQHQNNNLAEEFPQLLNDVDAQLAWADEVFGGAPDAQNLWIGDERSVTSFHKDHYENLYAVVSGCKIFTLLPPCDCYRLGLRSYPAATYQPVGPGGALTPVLKEPAQQVVWCPVDPNPKGADAQASAVQAHPLFFDETLPHPLRVEVHAGDVLYLPSLWYHHVEQHQRAADWVVAVNYWYDMKYDAKYAYFKFVEQYAAGLGLLPRQAS